MKVDAFGNLNCGKLGGFALPQGKNAPPGPLKERETALFTRMKKLRANNCLARSLHHREPLQTTTHSHTSLGAPSSLHYATANVKVLLSLLAPAHKRF